MVRETSRATYHQIKDEGLLSKRRFEVYQVLFKNNGPMTYSEIVMKFRQRKEFATSSTYQARLSELRDLGVVYEVKEDKCPLTGRHVIFWDVTAKLPKGKVKRAKSTPKGAIKLLKEVHNTLSGAFLGYDLHKKIERFLSEVRDDS